MAVTEDTLRDSGRHSGKGSKLYASNKPRRKESSRILAESQDGPALLKYGSLLL